MSRAKNEKLLHDIIAQAALEQDQGRLNYSPKLLGLMEAALTAMGTPEPQQHRFNLDGLEDLIRGTVKDAQDDSWRRLPIVVRMPDGRILPWMTLEVETITERIRRNDETAARFRAVILTPKDE